MELMELPVRTRMLSKQSPFAPVNTKPQSMEEHWNSLRRCQRCRSFYTEAENQEPQTSCHYHPGHYVDTNRFRDGIHVGWSCCRSEFKKDHLNENARGCHVKEFHLEDPVFKSILAHFPYDPEGNQEDQWKRMIKASESQKEERNKNTTTEEPTPDLEDMIDHPGYIAHRVTRCDTLAGLALKYKTSTSVIRRVNRLPNDMVFQRDWIFIPKTAGVITPVPSSDAIPHSQLIRIFIQETRCIREEASFYLEESDWNVEAAVSAWKEDCRWDKKN